MKERDCANCKHHTADGCSKWDCEFEAKDLISRADAIEAVHEYFRARLEESDGEWNDELQEYVFSKEDKRLLEYNKGVNTALKALPSADAVSREECDKCKTDKEGVLLQQLAELQGDYETMKNAYEDALADAVEVVRCKDCKYKRLYDEGDTKYYYCALEDRPNRNWSVDDTDYCSWGERREDGE